MRCPILSELPSPPGGKTGWPWTQESPQLPDTMPDGSPWPKVSIVTPSYNQGQFLEQTIRSVLLQGYPNLEYIVIDGGSTDGSIGIIRKYAPWLAYRVSEPDRGQSHGLNKGFDRATGAVFGWLNSDDYYQPGGLNILVQLRNQHPEAVAWVGVCQEVDRDGNLLIGRSPRVGSARDFANWGESAWIAQPACLFDAKTFSEIHKIDESLNYVMDVDLWMRLAERGPFATIEAVTSSVRMYTKSKSFSNVPMREAEHILISFKHGLPEVARHRMERCQIYALESMYYKDLVRYFIGRTVRGVRNLIYRPKNKQLCE